MININFLNFSLMEGEVRRLNIELDVYNKTVLELRKKLESDSKKSQEETTKLLEDKIKVNIFMYVVIKYI